MDDSTAARLAEGALLLTPHPRLARRLRAEYGRLQIQRKLAAWSSPQILTWNAWLDGCWETVLLRTGGGPARLGPWAENLLWEKVIEDSEAAAGLLSLDGAAERASEAWSLLHAWRMPLESPLFDFEEDPKAFRQWARGFDERVKDGGWIEDARLADFVAGNFAAGVLEAPRQVLLAGFDELTPQQEALVALVREKGWEIRLLPAYAARASHASLVRCQDVRDEVALAARWARSSLEQDPEANLAVVVAELAGHRDEIEREFLEVLHPDALARGRWPRPVAFHLSLGIPLARYAAVECALSLLDLAAGRVDLAAAGALLLSPYLKAAKEEAAARARLDASLREWGEAEVTPALLGQFARKDSAGTPVLADSLSRWFTSDEARPQPRSASLWASAFTKLLQHFGWPGDRPPDSREFQVIERWKEVLSEFASLSGLTGPMPAADAASLLARMAGETVFQVEDEDSPVQILGIGETGGLEADRLWLLGMHEDAWPPQSRPHPLLPLALQRKHNIPGCSPGRAFSTARRDTARLLSAAAEVLVSYPATDGESELRPSPLFAGLPIATDVPAPEYPRWADQIARRAKLQKFHDETAPPVPVGSYQHGGARIFQLQAACPFRAFAELRLNAEPLAEPSLGLEASDRGDLLHRALAYCWGEIHTRARLTSLSRAEVDAIIARAARRAMDETRAGRKGAIETALRRLELQVLQSLLASWFQMEAARGEDFTVMEQEKERRAELGGLQFHLRVDRVDELADGSQLVVDYKLKSKAVGPSSWDTERPDEPQLPLYAVTSKKAPAALAFGLFLPGEVKLSGLSAKPGLASGLTAWDEEEHGRSWAENLAEWRHVLERLAQDFREGRAEVDPKKPGTTCEYCPYPVLCRIEGMEGEDENG